MAASRVQTRRRQPVQARSRDTVEALLLAAARVLPPSQPQPLRDWLAAVQAAVLASQQFPSQALELVSGSARRELATRAVQLSERVLAALRQQRGHVSEGARRR
jgi:hypothetical protein